MCILFSWFGRLARRIRGRPHVLGRAPCAGSKIAVVVARQAAENDLLEQANLIESVLRPLSSLFSSSASPVMGLQRVLFEVRSTFPAVLIDLCIGDMVTLSY